MSPTDRLLVQMEQLMKEIEEVRKLNERMDKIAMFMEDIRLADIVQNYTAPRKLLWINFLAGLARGLGLTIGTALVLALLGSLLTQFLSIPIIGDYIKELVDYVQPYNQP